MERLFIELISVHDNKIQVTLLGPIVFMPHVNDFRSILGKLDQTVKFADDTSS